MLDKTRTNGAPLIEPEPGQILRPEDDGGGTFFGNNGHGREFERIATRGREPNYNNTPSNSESGSNFDIHAI